MWATAFGFDRLFSSGRRARRAGDGDGLRGFAEGVVGDRLIGWAFDPRQPVRRLSIMFASDPGVLRHVVADSYRADLQRAGYGDGHAGFSVPIAWFDAPSVRVFAAGHSWELPGSPISLRPAAAGGIERAVGSLRFHIDPLRPRAGVVTGWMLDAADPLWRHDVALRCGDVLVAQVRASRFRADLGGRAGDALHGFRLPVAARWRGKRLDLVEPSRGMLLARVRVP